jgi:uncharacterized membrane protein YhaH (DUF805 family)
LGTFSIWHWIIVLAVLVFLYFKLSWGAKICRKAGFSRAWTFIQIVPIVGIIFVWIFAFADWPAVSKKMTARQAK